jgi:hypothetical protein
VASLKAINAQREGRPPFWERRANGFMQKPSSLRRFAVDRFADILLGTGKFRSLTDAVEKGLVIVGEA